MEKTTKTSKVKRVEPLVLTIRDPEPVEAFERVPGVFYAPAEKLAKTPTFNIIPSTVLATQDKNAWGYKRVCPWFVACEKEQCPYRKPAHTYGKLVYCRHIPDELEYKGPVPDGMGYKLEDVKKDWGIKLLELLDVEGDNGGKKEES